MLDTRSTGQRRARLIAYYLPQYYPIPENDEWWGKGFTEWASVARARPLFRGHRQPRVPGALGFYDLRLPETRGRQADLAKAHGIEAFCYWHYWFDGSRLLERPFDEVLSSGEPDFPFCLAWANQPWTDTWLGSGRVLKDQCYSHEDDVAHARWLLDAFADRRYLRVDGRPLFVVFRPLDLPDPRRTTDTLRAEIARAGLPEPLLLGIDAHSWGHDFRADGFDGTVGHEPSLGLLPHNNAPTTLSRPWRRMSRAVRNVRLGAWSASVKVHSYRRHVQDVQRKRDGLAHHQYRTLLLGWDNTPRRGRAAIVLVDDTLPVFEEQCADLVRRVQGVPFEDRLIFLNAWNEWAEGAFLEPSVDEERERLEAVRRAVCPE